jgi:hypothetical protein
MIQEHDGTLLCGSYLLHGKSPQRGGVGCGFILHVCHVHKARFVENAQTETCEGCSSWTVSSSSVSYLHEISPAAQTPHSIATESMLRQCAPQEVRQDGVAAAELVFKLLAALDDDSDL